MNKYRAEAKQLLGTVDEEVVNLLKDYKCYIAGGAITSLFTNKDINDLFRHR